MHQSAPMAGVTVLLADDDDDFRTTLRRVLVEQGYDVIAVADGATTLELLAEAADGKRQVPNIVLLDVMMPGCSGLGILSAMRRFGRRPATFVMTSFADPSVDVVARRLGARRVLHKPVELDDLLAELEASIVQSGGTKEVTPMKLRSIMTRDVLTLTPSQPASDALASMRDAGVRHAVVRSKDSIDGIVSERDLGGPHGGLVRRGHTVEELMHRGVRYAGSDTTIEDAALLMRAEHIGCLPVVDRGELVGIVTRGDLLTALAHGRKAKSRALTNRNADAARPVHVASPNRDKWP